MEYYDVEIDEGNEGHVTRHGVSVTEIVEVFRNAPVVRRNRRERSAGYTAIGVTDAGRQVKVAFDHDAGVVRPIAAWEVR